MSINDTQRKFGKTCSQKNQKTKNKQASGQTDEEVHREQKLRGARTHTRAHRYKHDSYTHRHMHADSIMYIQ